MCIHKITACATDAAQAVGLWVFVIRKIGRIVAVDKPIEQINGHDHDQTHGKDDAGNRTPGYNDQDDQSQDQGCQQELLQKAHVTASYPLRYRWPDQPDPAFRWE